MIVVWLSQVLFKTFCSIIPFNFVNLGKLKTKELKSIIWSSQTKWVSQHTNLKRLISKLVFFMLWLFYLFLSQTDGVTDHWTGKWVHISIWYGELGKKKKAEWLSRKQKYKLDVWMLNERSNGKIWEESLHLQGHREATAVKSHISESEFKEKLKTILNINYPLNEKQMSGTLTCWGKASISNVWDIPFSKWVLQNFSNWFLEYVEIPFLSVIHAGTQHSYTFLGIQYTKYSVLT